MGKRCRTVWWLCPPLLGVWSLVILGGVVNLVAAVLYEFRWPTGLFDYCSSHWPGMLLGFLLLVVLTVLAWAGWRFHRATGHFSLWRDAGKLSPEDLRFKETRLGDEPDPHYYIYNQPYLPRRIVRYGDAAARNRQREYTEEDLARFLREGKGFLLLGPKMGGKSRTLYEVVRRTAEDSVIVIPRVGTEVPGGDAFRILRDERVVLLLDNLDRYEGVDWTGFCDELNACEPESWAVAATCLTSSDGREGQVVYERKPRLHEFYRHIHFELEFMPMIREDQEKLRESPAAR